MSRELSALHPLVATMARNVLNECDRQGLKVVVSCTLRTLAEQAELYKIGRTLPGRRVTNAGPGDSWHNWGRAIDIYPLLWGKLADDKSPQALALWEQLGAIGEKAGFEWGGRWKRIDRPHFQATLGATLAALKAGQKLA